MKLFKQEIIERFLVAVREIYRKHPVYSYVTERKQTNLQIHPTYANPTWEERVPIFLVKVGSYDTSRTDSMFGNYTNDVYDDNGRVIGKEFFQQISTYITVLVKAKVEEESSNLADELASLGLIQAKSMFSQVGINILGVNVSETQEVDNANDTYQTIVNFRVDAQINSQEIYSDPAGDPEIEFEFPQRPAGLYREPRASVFETRLKPK